MSLTHCGLHERLLQMSFSDMNQIRLKREKRAMSSSPASHITRPNAELVISIDDAHVEVAIKGVQRPEASMYSALR
eukprot:4226335-Amphidinium_carterae.1